MPHLRGRKQLIKAFIEVDGLKTVVKDLLDICTEESARIAELGTLERYNAPKWARAADALEPVKHLIENELKI